MKNFPQYIEVVVEPEVFLTQDNLDAIRITTRVKVNGIEISVISTKPLNFFISHFDQVFEDIKYLIKKELKET